ncbi:MAG: phytoene/squalene synthase family protein [Candidatus Eisenbacteria bacterium]
MSRTFALTIRVLPPSLRDSVTIAYLLCRVADVLEDSPGIDARTRRAGLLALAEALGGVSQDSDAHGAGLRFEESDPSMMDRLIASLRETPHEGLDAASRGLLESQAEVFRAFLDLPPLVRGVIARWVQAMSRGMAEFVAKEASGPESTGLRLVLQTREEMRAYAYCVAGTVGHLLTELFTHHLRLGESRTARLRELAVPFGLGLQLTNILQDLAEDRERGCSYLPEDLARSHGTTLARLHQASDRTAALRVVADVIEEAARHLDDAMEFTLLLPRTAPRIRLFCLWPIFFARRTLVRLWAEPAVLDGPQKVRISRAEVRSLMRNTVLGCGSNARLARLSRQECDRLAERAAIRPV